MSSSDRSRTSDDRRYHYKAVVAQQGRVIVDRDLNALETILIERADRDVLDIVGPAGTPDNGFEISVPGASPPPPGSPSAPFDFSVGPGSMYVGGQRVDLPATIAGAVQNYSYFSQPDWIAPDDPVPSGSPPAFAGQSPSTGIEDVWLDVYDQEVSATEDPDLKEVALGGPDTTGRVRLMRRVRRTPVHESDCCAAWDELTGGWLQQSGLGFDAHTRRLVPRVGLKVAFQQDPNAGDACDPVAQGGYLYSENQAIRIQISASGAGATPVSFLWGYDDASFIYRISSVSNGGTQLQLTDSPPDAFHWPKNGQVVEILRTAVVLGTAPDANDPSQNIVRCVAEATGELRTLSQSYGATTQGGTANYLTFANPLPADYINDPNPLFVRIWQSQQQYTPGGTALLDGTNNTTNGVVVMLTAPSNLPMTVGAYWIIALRPSTPQAVYPERFLTGPQPPHGPAHWACALGTIDWTTQPPTVTDCRSKFDNLVTLSKRKPGCCTIAVTPTDCTGARTLQDIIDAAVLTADTVKVCFAPGAYYLPQTLRLDRRHAGIVLEACTRGAHLLPDPNASAALFQDGVLAMVGAPGITLSGLEFSSVDVPLPEQSLKNLELLARVMAIEVDGLKLEQLFEQTTLWADPEGTLAGAVQNLTSLICVRSLACTLLTIENCSFIAASQNALAGRVNSMAIGFLAQGECSGLTVIGCRFRGNTQRATPGLLAILKQRVVKAAPPPAAGAAPAAPVLDALTGAAAPAVAAPDAARGAKKKAAGKVAQAAAAKSLVEKSIALDPGALLHQLPASIDFTLPHRAADRNPIAMGAGCLIIPRIVNFEFRDAVQFAFSPRTRLLEATLSGNEFQDLTLAAASVADTGIVRAADNSVSGCAAGLWFATWHRNGLVWNPQKPAKEGADQLLRYALMCEETALMLFAPMMLPQPQTLLQSELRIDVKSTVKFSPELLSLAAALHLSGNDIDCTPSPSSPTAAGSSMPLAIFNDAPQRNTSLNIASNRLVGSLPTINPTVLASLYGDLTFNGNQLTNAIGGMSLLIDIDGVSTSTDELKVGLTATGNVFNGPTNLKLLKRQGFPAPLNTWEVFNANFPP